MDRTHHIGQSSHPGLPSGGNRQVRIAVLDGPVDLDHPCFQGADLTLLPSLVADEPAERDPMAAHGTHVASVIFGQPGSCVEGLAPGCSGLIIPVFSSGSAVSQLDLARAMELAVEHGAHIINISGGQLTDSGEADSWLHNAMRLCVERNVLVVAAAGNDGCACLHVPAALPMVLPVGALDHQNRPMEFSNWGDKYRGSGLMAPGQDILGAKPGDGTAQLNGTSFATPIVTAAAALLLSRQVERAELPDPQMVRQLLLETALPCAGAQPKDSGKCLAGRLNLPGAFERITGSGNMTDQSIPADTTISPQCACQDEEQGATAASAESAEDTGQWIAETAQSAPVVAPSSTISTAAAAAPAAAMGQGNAQTSGAMQASAAAPVAQAGGQPGMQPGVTASAAADEDGGMVYALGVLGYDFGSEARRDSFKQLMPPNDSFPANPFDARQMVDYLADNLAEARSLIWTLNIELTPVYAIDPVGPFAREVYQGLVTLLDGEIQAETAEDYVERVSIPGRLTGRTVRLFSGQVVPVIEPQNTRGLYGWRTNVLVQQALEESGVEDPSAIELSLSGFLNRVYYDLRNLGKTSRDRAMNFSVTNAFQAASSFGDALAAGMQLDDIEVTKSPFCRMDSDCWDIKLKFFDPENDQRAKRIYRYTVDVSDLIPVTMGEVRSWTASN